MAGDIIQSAYNPLSAELRRKGGPESCKTGKHLRDLTTTDPQHNFVKVELEIKVDGGGGAPGNEVTNIAQQWIWNHGRKVKSSSLWSSVNNEMVKCQLRE